MKQIDDWLDKLDDWFKKLAYWFLRLLTGAGGGAVTGVKNTVNMFEVSARGTTVATEIRAGITTFLTMAYIMFVNPTILAKAGMDYGAVFVATCLAAAVGSLLMGLLANLPVALAPGIGLNVYFAFAVVPAVGGSWQIALGCIFIAGVLFVILSLTPLREALVDAIPLSLKTGIAAGVGLFLALVGFSDSGLVADHPVTLVTLGDVSQTGVILASIGLLIIAGLTARKIPGAIIIGIFAVTIGAIALGDQKFVGLMSWPPSLAPTFLQLDIEGALTSSLIIVIFTFLLIDILDTAGTLVGVGIGGYILDRQGRLPKLRRALIADSSATVVGSLFGTSTTTSYMESAAGIQEGGRTGLTAITVGVLFLISLFFAPLAETVPNYATAPALIFVACMMIASFRYVIWEDVTEYVPAVVTAIMMPLSYSIATGIGLGFITYLCLKIAAGRYDQVNWAVALIVVMFLAKLALS